MKSNDSMNLQGQTNHVHDQFKIEVNTKKIIKKGFILRSLAWSKPVRLKATKAGEGEEIKNSLYACACTSMPMTPNTSTCKKVNFQKSMSCSKTTKEMKHEMFLKFPLKNMKFYSTAFMKCFLPHHKKFEITG